ncbi:MAG: CLI_3235 family bacteriocin precursor [Lachnospiraceae bacterium]|nr:CLI_3235 family bacteriocin precursor [Lachnospiraceae bacterium]
MKLGKKNTMETGTFMAYACSCTCWCACKCNNCHNIGTANGTQIANSAETSSTKTQTRGPLSVLG